ncbi:MAG TPA: hypothetical protein VNI84_04040 [Pyrinomonadaceae bacterium]|nr:hypothetical protein [Pyrinomonadaceae bacterium]
MAKPILSSLDFNNSSRALNLPAPASPNEPARLADLNSAVEGLSWKKSARVATQANVSLASPGATIDGITMAANDRVLVRAQTAGAENGIYIYNGGAAAMARSLDASTSDELENATISIDEGTSAGTTYRQSLVNFVLGTGSPAFTTFGTSAPVASTTTSGTVTLATQAEVHAGTEALDVVTPATLTAWTGRIKKYTTTIGDGTATSFTITHNLATKVHTTELYYTGGTFDKVDADVQHTSATTDTVIFSSAPAAGAVTFVAIG